MTSPMLELVGLRKNFGGLMAVDELDIIVNSGEILGLIGPNGAGKTTLYNVISWIYKTSSGKAIF